MFSPPSGDVFGGRGVISVVGEQRLMFLIEKLQLTIIMRSKETQIQRVMNDISERAIFECILDHLDSFCSSLQ